MTPMNNKNAKGLGRGLSSLIPAQSQKLNVASQVRLTEEAKRATAQTHPTEGLMELPIASITPNPLQPRLHFDERNLQELADSIKEYGVLEPIVVTAHGAGQWQLIAGERRFRASQLAGKATIPAIVRTATELERLEIALIENIQRADLNPIEQAQSLAKLVHDFGLTQEQAAKKLGMARSSLANSIRLLELPDEIQQALMERKITEGHAKVLLGIENPQAQLELYKQMTSGRAMSVKELSSLAKNNTPSKKHSVHTVVNDFETRMLEEQMQSALNTKVRIEPGAKGKKSIVIDTFSPEQLQSVVRKLTS